MKLDLDELKDLYDAIDDEDFKDMISDFEMFKQYAINELIDNLEYDLNVCFSDYVDLNRFIIEE